MAETSSAREPDPVPAALVRHWVVCGLVAATARFVPVPVVDDALADRAVRESVRRTLREHGRGYDVAAVEPLTGRRGRRGGLLRSLPGKVLTWPVRKWTRLAGAVRGVPADLTLVLAVARATHRVLERGGLADGTPEAALREEAAAVRRSVEAALEELDLRLVRAALADALGGAKGLGGALVDYARDRFDTDRERDGDALHPPGEVDAGVDRVVAALRQPEVRRMVVELDDRVDAHLATASGRA